MNSKKKLDNLIRHSASVFQTNNNVHINARKAVEALCKLIIFRHYGEEKGTSILYKKDDEWNRRLRVTNPQQKKSHPMVLNMLIQVCTSEEILRACYEEDYQKEELSEVIRNTKIYLESNLYALNNRGNISAHETYNRPLYAETTQNLLREVLEWLFQDFLKTEIPNELVCYIGTYDIFISYYSADRAWVEVLKKNLVAHGYKLFIADYQIAGSNIKKSLRTAIKHSRNAIVVYPEKADSPWIQNELEWIEEKRDKDSNFHSIPIVMYTSLNLPPETINYTDFTNQDYAQAFNQLLCSLEQVPPTEDHVKCTLELPVTSNQFVNKVMQNLEQEKVLMLFSQEFSKMGQYLNPIKKQLSKKFQEHFYTLSIPPFREKKYFNTIAENCGIEENVESFQDWKNAMRKKLSRGEEMLLLVTDLDNGKKKCNGKFASTLRSLSEEFNDNFYVVLVGRKELAELVFQESNLSPLKNIGKYLFFPYDRSPIARDKIELIIAHPLIVEYRELLLKLLEKRQLGYFSPWSYNELINYLFWKGILIEEDGYYVWRSEELREMIIEILNSKGI